jgi:hypothetical protein
MRDPRIDPKPGDSIARINKQAKGGLIIRDVLRSHGGFVCYRQDNGYTFRSPKFVTLNAFRKWTAKAEYAEAVEVSE